jgi:L-ascorbate metabolism protein UlaG (beta-lactamase superfamily)
MLVHRLPSRSLLVALAGALAALALIAPARLAPSPAAQAQTGTVRMEWLGWSHFRFTSPGGTVVLTNPFIDGNPDAAVSVDDVNQADLIVLADGHRDEVGSAVAIAQKTGARLFVPFELGIWLTEQGVPAAQVVRSNPGGRLSLGGITVRMVGSVHGSGLTPPTATTPYGGPAAGFVITFENGWTVYFTGSSAATQDMALWGSLYKPDAMIFHMGTDHEPLDIATSIRLVMTDNPNLSTLLPHHHRISPPAGATSVADVQAALDSMGIGIPITDQVRSQVYEFTK